MNIYKIFRPLVFRLNPEKAHDLAVNFLRFFPNFINLFTLNKDYQNLEINLWGKKLSNPIGMAAGFDKNAQIALSLAKFGFGFIEVGTVTPKPQIGNEKPRIFRLQEDLAIINRLGFNNLGAEIFDRNIDNIRKKAKEKLILGLNIGKNKDSKDAVLDYITLLERFYNKASYITINISSPNTKNLRNLQKKEKLEEFLTEILRKKNELAKIFKKNVPVLLKIAPDLEKEELKNIAQTITKGSEFGKIDGVIIGNTTISRDFRLKSINANQTGGLSGKPLFVKSNAILKQFYILTEGKIPLIGVGGIFSARDAYDKIKNGASLVQIYSSFIYQGFGVVEKIKKDLSYLVEEDGFENISQAVGCEAKP